MKDLKTISLLLFSLLGIVACGSSSSGSTSTPPPKTPQVSLLSNVQMTQMVSMLTSSAKNVGLSYVGTAGRLNGVVLPLSYYSTIDYWGAYVCTLPGNDCTVTDVYDPIGYTLTPESSTPGANLQWERVNVTNGTDIYDGATWQMAMSLAAKHHIPGSSYDYADNQDQLLTLGYDGNATGTVVLNANRANTSSFVYGGVAGQDIPANEAYTFRMVTQSWLSTDPFKLSSTYSPYITASGLPGAPYESGMVTWGDWKPITGENTWAFFIGPLQSAYMKYDGNVPFSSAAVQNAVNLLYSVSLMQSPIGALYYAPSGSLGNVGGEPVSPYMVSIENNASSLAGLLILQKILTNPESSNPTAIDPILANLNGIINGGSVTFNNGSYTKQTAGLLSFFKNYAFDESQGIFVQEGHANDPAYAESWVVGVDPNGNDKTVDVNTWSVSVLGVPLVDSWFGPGTAYNVWQNVKSFGGFYGPDNTLWGVGYSDQDGNGYTNGTPQFTSNGILSTEWTAGAINMVRIMANQYGSESSYTTSLNADIQSMEKGVMSLRTDNYTGQSTAFPDAPPNYGNLVVIPNDKLGFMYASKRYFIPFGWYANPLPSLCSVSWMIMLNYDFNPFTLGGGYEPNFAAQ